MVRRPAERKKSAAEAVDYMSQGDFKRWLYRGQRPNWIARMLNRALAAVGSSGVASNYPVTLEVAGTKVGADNFSASRHGRRQEIRHRFVTDQSIMCRTGTETMILRMSEACSRHHSPCPRPVQAGQSAIGPGILLVGLVCFGLGVWACNAYSERGPVGNSPGEAGWREGYSPDHEVRVRKGLVGML
jgi:hypothetical protein